MFVKKITEQSTIVFAFVLTLKQTSGSTTDHNFRQTLTKTDQEHRHQSLCNDWFLKWFLKML